MGVRYYLTCYSSVQLQLFLKATHKALSMFSSISFDGGHAVNSGSAQCQGCIALRHSLQASSAQGRRLLVLNIVVH